MSIKVSTSEMKQLGTIIDGILNGNKNPKEVGFVVLTFDFFKQPNKMNYISNAQRSDMIKFVEELLLKWKTEIN